MELRSFNVEYLYSRCVKCLIGDTLCIDKDKFNEHLSDIKDLLSQIETVDGYVHLCACNRRTDGEIWTPYLQIVEMLIRMGERAKFVKYEGKLRADTLIKIEL